MNIVVQAENGREVIYKFLTVPLEESVLYMHQDSVITLDRFLLPKGAFRDLIIPIANLGNTLNLTISANPDEIEKYNPKLLHCTGVDLTKNNENFKWEEYFNLPEKYSMINNNLRIFPDEDIYNCSIPIKSELDPTKNLKDIYIKYSAEISLELKTESGGEKHTVYFKFDPLVKISSTQNDTEDF